MHLDEAIEYSHGSWGPVMIWLGLPLIFAIALGTLAAGIFSAGFSDDGIWWRAQGLVVTAVALWLMTSTIHWFRERHAFRTRYRLDDRGIQVEYDDRLGVLVAWADVAEAIDCRAMRSIKVTSSGLDVPIVLIFGAPGEPRIGPQGRHDLTRGLLQEKLATRYHRRWLAW